MTPLILLVGFLGAGKTTYLRGLLPALRALGIEPHVIINDYQNARVDAELLRELTASIVPISGSCVCCGSREELLGALENFPHAPERVAIIETNGTTDAEELLELLALTPSLVRFTQPIQMSIIDGQRWQKRFWHNALELAQTRTAAFVFVSREEEIDDRRRAKVAESMSRHHLPEVSTAPEAFASEIATILTAVRDLAGRDKVAHPGGECECGHDHEHHHSHQHPEAAHAGHHFASLQIDLPEVTTRETLVAFLNGLPREIIRVKGVARLADSPNEYHVFQRVEDAPIQWLPVGATNRVGRSLAVLIGPGVDAAAIHRKAGELFGTSEPSIPPA